MMDDFQFLYGNDEKMNAASEAAIGLFSTEGGELVNLGPWNANTNDPVLIDGTGIHNNYYIVSVAGTQDLGSGSIVFAIDDIVKYDSLSEKWKLSVNEDLDGTGAGILLDVTEFNNNLSPADTNVQKAFETLDDLVIPGSGGQVDSVVAGTDITIDNTDPINPIVNYAGTSGDVYLDKNNVFTKAQRGWIEPLIYSANITPDFNTSNRYGVSLTGNTVIENPTNISPGQGGVIYIEQDVTGSRIATWGTYWKFANTYTEDTSASKINIFGYEVYSSTQIVVNFLGTI